MPPSGYTRHQSSGIRAALNSCAQALELELKVKGLTHVQALEKEINDIAGFVNSAQLNSAQVSILLLTEAFYKEVLRLKQEERLDFWTATEKALHVIEDDMLSIKI